MGPNTNGLPQKAWSPYGQKTRTHCFMRMSLNASALLLISGPQVRSLYGPPMESSTYTFPAQTPFSIKPVLNLFQEIGLDSFLLWS